MLEIVSFFLWNVVFVDIFQLESEKALQDMQFSHNTPKPDFKKVSLKKRAPKMLDRNY